MTSAERIRILRERAGLSQNDLAVKLDLSRSSISMYETGEQGDEPEDAPIHHGAFRYLNDAPILCRDNRRDDGRRKANNVVVNGAKNGATF